MYEHNIKTNIYSAYIKRLIDFILAIVGLITLAPLIVIIALLVKVKLGSPVIFKQNRPGINEEIFKLFKFRTMTDETNPAGVLLPDSIRLNKFGRLLRSTSLDELPSLINILKGDMSVVGPRPLAVQYLPYYEENEKLRHAVRPGLTGLAQVNGRNSVTWEERFNHDLYYVSNVSFLMDIKIIVKTIQVIVSRKDIGERGVTSPIDFDEYRKIEKRR